MHTTTPRRTITCWSLVMLAACAAGCGSGYTERLRATLKAKQEAEYEANAVDLSQPPGEQGGEPAEPAEPTDGLQGTRWTPNPGVMRQLGEEVTVAPFMFRPPAAYAKDDSLQLPEDLGFDLQLWKGQQRADGSTPQLVVQLTDVPAEATGIVASPMAIEMYFQVASTQFADWSAGDVEQGYVDQLQLVRARYSGVSQFQLEGALGEEPAAAGAEPAADEAAAPADGVAVAGVIYMAVQGDKAIIIMSQDTPEHAEQSESLHAAAAMTLRAA